MPPSLVNQEDVLSRNLQSANGLDIEKMLSDDPAPYEDMNQSSKNYS
jgi:hypothetical protein